MKIIDNTSVEKHYIHCYPKRSHLILVKREDTACLPPGPPFSKMRGCMAVLTRLKEEGVKVIGYTETSISMAGWGVAYGCELLGLKAVIYDPQYKETPPLLKFHRKKWRKHGATLIPIKAGMARVNFNIAKNLLKEEYGEEAVMLPLGLPFEESVGATYREAVETRRIDNAVASCRSIVVNVGSGTICAGVVKGFIDKTVYGIMGRTGNVEKKRSQILKKAQIIDGGLFHVDFRLIDPGWEYTQESEIKVPFPCHPFYDAKAWQWLVENVNNIKPPILFWNIGRPA